MGSSWKCLLLDNGPSLPDNPVHLKHSFSTLFFSQTGWPITSLCAGLQRETWHSILPVTIGELLLFRTDNSFQPYGSIMERGFIFEAVLPAVPHDVRAILAPNRMSIIGEKAVIRRTSVPSGLMV